MRPWTGQDLPIKLVKNWAQKTLPKRHWEIKGQPILLLEIQREHFSCSSTRKRAQKNAAICVRSWDGLRQRAMRSELPATWFKPQLPTGELSQSRRKSK